MKRHAHIFAACICMLTLQLTACSSQTAEEKAKEMATEKVDMAKSIGDVLQEKGMAAAESVTSGMGKVVRGVERGVEKSGRFAEVTDAAKQAGLQVTKVQLATAVISAASDPAEGSAADPEVRGLDLYVLTSQDVKGTMKIKIHNALDQEIGRVKLPFVQEADEGRYVRVTLDAQVDLQAITRVEVDFTPQATEKLSSK